jgi:hypothetical protein
VSTRLEQGFRMITVTNEIIAMRTELARNLAAARGATPTSAPTAPSTTSLY